MKKRATLFLTLILCLGAGPAFADCCDTFFSCAAAYATDGLSCVLTEIISTIHHLVDLMHNLTDRVNGSTAQASNEARQYVSETIAQIRNDAQFSSTGLAAALQQANSLYKGETALVSVSNRGTAQISKPVNPPPPPPPASARPANAQQAKPTGPLVGHSLAHPSTGAVPVTPPPPPPTSTPKVNAGVTAVAAAYLAPPNALAGLFEKAISEIQKAKAAGDQDYPKITTLMNQAEQTEGPALQSALAVADQAMGEPVRKMVSFLEGMLTDPTSVWDPSDVVDKLADDLMANLDTNMDKLKNGIIAGPQTAFDAAQGAHDDLVAQGQRAQALVVAMQAAYTQRTKAAEDALGELLPLTALATTNNIRAKMVVPLGNLAAYTQIMGKFKSNTQKIVPAAHQRMQALLPVLAEYKAVRNKALAARASAAAYKTNFNMKLSTTFANKTQAEINTMRDQLIAQARSQYGNDPRIRDKVIALLTSETAKIKPAH